MGSRRNHSPLIPTQQTRYYFSSFQPETPTRYGRQSFGLGGNILFGIPIEFYLLGATLLGVAIFHEQATPVALFGLAGVASIKILHGFPLLSHSRGEAGMLANLAALLMGFAVLARHFEDSKLPDRIPSRLPATWIGPFVLLAAVFLLSAVLDNIAAAVIGGALARKVFASKLHVGYLAALAAASNAGGAWSVLGDTTSTMLWIAGVPAAHIARAAVGSLVALVTFGLPAAWLQHQHQTLQSTPHAEIPLDWKRLALTAAVLIGAALANVAWALPGLGIWAALLAFLPWVPMPWKTLRQSLRGAVFLCALVLAASLMPVEALPAASVRSTFALGLVSAFFDNIPLTRLALLQGGYDWGFLAFAVGYGGSLLWFGSSAGVALASDFPEARSTWKWIREGWPVALGYIAGFAALLWGVGWHVIGL